MCGRLLVEEQPTRREALTANRILILQVDDEWVNRWGVVYTDGLILPDEVSHTIIQGASRSDEIHY